jgi:NADP-dependent 3-hydroxy acid dehydrogenase YdfG
VLGIQRAHRQFFFFRAIYGEVNWRTMLIQYTLLHECEKGETSMNVPVNERVWFLTGSSTGIGRAVADELVSRGVKLIATARDPETLDELAKAGGQNVVTASLDVQSQDSIDDAVGKGLERFGRIDTLLGCAGTGLVGSIEESSDSEIDFVFQVNFFGTLRVIRTILPAMKERGSGMIATITSRGAYEGHPGTGIYCASKFALNGMSEALAAEVKPLGIDCTIIEPGLVKSNFRAKGITRAKRRLPEYDQTCGKLRDAVESEFPPTAYEAPDVAIALIAALNQSDPPLHLVLGGIAVDQTRTKFESMLSGLAKWEPYSRLEVPSDAPGASVA